ncbi:MAG: hypothetical protein Q8K01_10940 [Sulfurimicrobium sp.]|nr:hypothetical protein [Sulfurimicrobium sp.]
MTGLTVYLAIAVITARWLWRFFKRRAAKWAVVLGVLLAFFLIPTGDVIIGNYYFAHLCEKEGGANIYKTVELGDEFFLKPGEIDVNTAGRLPAKGGELNIKKIKTGYSITTDSRLVSNTLHIEKHITTISDPQSGQVLATDTQFFHFGGWLENNIRMDVHGDSCPAKTMGLDLVFKHITDNK